MNNSAPGPDGVGYRLIKAVRDTRLGRELVGEIVDSLVRGEIPEEWRHMRAVFIPKPRRDLKQPHNWRPLNLINCVGKLGEKVVADRLQDCGDSLFHHLQFGLVKGRSATDVLYKAVKTAMKVLDGGRSVGWGFWDVKGGFQNVVGEEVLGSVSVVEECRQWCKWLGAFLSPREFEVSWDGMVRGAGWTDRGVP